ncbi:GntR family transcriptional regulator [Neobacillus vireti]|uniref:GntR family transcriptional regulator n=1 Tax=Neobacillus vireti TaxID=220686 RepID=UPI002FFDEB03
MNILNKESSIPLYQQLASIIKQQINKGILKENDKILTATELSEKYEVSLITVKKAIDLLAEEGTLVKQQGKGTFVATRKLLRTSESFMGFTQLCEMQGYKASSEVIKVDFIIAPISDVEKLNLQEEERIIRIIRVRKCDGVPVIIEESHFPMQYSFLLSEDLTGSINKHLNKHGVIINQGIKTINICYATEDEAKILDIQPNQALILQKEYNKDENGIPVHTCKQVINADRYEMVIPFKM